MGCVLLGDGLHTSAQGFGAMAVSGVYGQTDASDAARTIHHAIDIGVRLIDSANVYGNGENEKLIGKVLRTRRDEVVLATKFGIPTEPDPYRARGDAAYVHSSVRESLTRLRTDVIDLYYYHRVDPRVPIEETVGALAELVQAGAIRHIGLSEVTAEELRRAHAVHPIAAVQSEWSLWSRDVEASVVPTAAALGIGFVPYSPLGRGFFTGWTSADLAPDDLRRKFPRFTPERLSRNRALIEALLSEASGLQVTPAQLALAWLYAKGRAFGLPVVPIPGTRRASRVEENAAAAFIELGDSVVGRLDALAAGVVGDRASDLNWISQGREQAQR
ncbi:MULTISPECIES: aldo/keto reductase [unclassified Diaminobutyricimonas]|uniref:aldo/keto reductase n=1 Tax=unclassified Diaminobutyricimonas TaxID=2643261 RepID=UPI0012F4D13A|nr:MULTISPECIES: aldo/keto reductase [unclassified Diaminobutyricimonas]